MRTILDTKNEKAMFSSDGFGVFVCKGDNFNTYDCSCVEKEINIRRKIRQHRHDRHVELIEFYDYDANSYYDYGVDAIQKR